MKVYGDELLQWLKAKKITQKAFAERLGVAAVTVHCWIYEDVDISDKCLDKLTEAVGSDAIFPMPNKVAETPKCAYCGREFKPKAKSRYCSEPCRAKGKAERGLHNQPCWTCVHGANRYGKCPWSAKFEPVKGWKAIPSTKIDGSYRILFCPLYEKERR